MDAPEREKKFGKFIPIIIENHTNEIKKRKFMVPSHCTASQLLNILRAKMHMSPCNPLYLFLKGKHRPLQASKCIGHLHQKYRNEKGCLHLIQAEQSTFGFRGNIRAIRFRQKWMENILTYGPSQATIHLPHYFPADPPSPVQFFFNTPMDDPLELPPFEALMNFNNQQMTIQTLESELLVIYDQMNNAYQNILHPPAQPTEVPANPVSAAPTPSVNTTTIQMTQGTSHTVNGLSIQVMQPTTIVQTTTTHFLQTGDGTTSFETHTFHQQGNSQIDDLVHYPSSGVESHIIESPNELVHPATQQQAANVQLQTPNQQVNTTTTIQLLDPDSQQVNASVEWMQLGNQPDTAAVPTYETLYLLPEIEAADLEATENILALLPY